MKSERFHKALPGFKYRRYWLPKIAKYTTQLTFAFNTIAQNFREMYSPEQYIRFRTAKPFEYTGYFERITLGKRIAATEVLKVELI